MCVGAAIRPYTGQKTNFGLDAAGRVLMMRSRGVFGGSRIQMADGLKSCVPLAMAIWGMYLLENATHPKTRATV